MSTWTRRLAWILVAALAAAAFVRAFRSPPVLVDTAVVERGRLEVTVEDDGRTRVRERYVVSAPVDGELLRVALDPGAAVLAGETVLAEFAPRAVVPLDARERAQVEARVAAAEAALERARAEEGRAAAALDYARIDLQRQRQLGESGIESAERLDRAVRDERAAAEALRAAGFQVAVAGHQLVEARALLLEGGTGSARALALRSPIDGVVLRLHEESARTLVAGAPILEVGDVAHLEIVADLLSQDAVAVRPGMEALVEGWGPEGSALRGTVRHVEPAGYTKISALGVEEQRVDVLVDPLETWDALRDGFRVELRIVVWRGEDVLVVPTGALFRAGERWAAFVVEDEHAVRRDVELGRRGGLQAEVLSGLAEGERVVLYPSELIEPGARVEVR
jgi:HlyD family secretion protein